MKVIKGAIIFLILGALIMGVTQAVFARTGSESGTGTWVDSLVDPNAVGAKVAGTLAIDYTDIGKKKCSEIGYPNKPPYTGFDAAKMIFTLRLSKGEKLGDKLYPFSGSADVCYTLYEDHATILKDFITDNVIPVIFKSKPNAPWKLKNVNYIVEDDNSNPKLNGCCSEFFTIMNILLTVDLCEGDPVCCIVQPNGGDILISGAGYNVVLRIGEDKLSSPVAEYELFYTCEGKDFEDESGKSIWKLITTRTCNPKVGCFPEYSWEVPSMSKERSCKMKVLLKDKNGKTIANDASNGYFGILPYFP